MSKEQADSELQFPLIDSQKDEIRLLEILAGQEHSPLIGKYHVVDLNEPNHSYEALSYAWGTAEAVHSIRIDQGSAKMTPGLFNAINRLRYADRSRYLWIDALCINQTDNHEKSQQVSMMDRIYTRCEQCVIWLDRPSTVQPADAEAVLDVISWWAGTKEEPSWVDDPARCDSVGLALKVFMNLAWWKRIWTVQEIILPPKSTLMWGEYSVDRANLYRAADSFFDETNPGSPDELWRNGAILDLQSQMRGLEMTKREGLLQVLVRWRGRHATDLRDKVYALLGFRTDLALPNMRSCDYTIDTRTLYKRVTADLIRAEGNLLPIIGRRGEVSDFARDEESWPSWALDWNEPNKGERVQRFWQHQSHYIYRDFTADRGLYGVQEELKMIGDDILCLHGMNVDKVVTVEDADSDRSGSSDGSTFSKIFGLVRRWEDVVEKFQQEKPDVLKPGWVQNLLSVAVGNFVPSDPDHNDEVEEYIDGMVQLQSLFITESGKFGLGPLCTKPGHEVWVVGGSKFPFLLDPAASSSGFDDDGLDFTLVADCLVNGIMHGEAVEESGQEPVVIRLH